MPMWDTPTLPFRQVYLGLEGENYLIKMSFLVAPYFPASSL